MFSKINWAEHSKQKPLWLRFTADGLEITRKETSVNASLKFLDIDGSIFLCSCLIVLGLKAKFLEWVFGAVITPEKYDDVEFYFGKVIAKLEHIQVYCATTEHSLITLQEHGLDVVFPTDSASARPVDDKVWFMFIFSPDAKMANLWSGHASNGSSDFCACCDVTSELLKSEPFKRWEATTTKVKLMPCRLPYLNRIMVKLT